MIDEFLNQVTEPEPLIFINAATWLDREPVPPDQLLRDVWDRGDKLAIIGLSKLWKSFLALQLSISLTAGRPFLNWNIEKRRRGVMCQFEVRDNHYHRRVRSMCRALGITPGDLGDRLHILNGRGLGLSGAKGIARIEQNIINLAPDFVMIDPLYKVASGVENAAEDAKIILTAFDQLAERTGAAVSYVHHDAKGSPGDRDIRDRGAGSNVLSRDYDVCFAMTGHAQQENAVVIDVLLRNYPPQDPLVIEFANHGDGYCFHVCDDLAPEKKTSRTRKEQTPLSTYVSVVKTLLDGNELHIANFKEQFKARTGLSDNRIKQFLNWAQAGGRPLLLFREERGRGIHNKWIQINADYE